MLQLLKRARAMSQSVRPCSHTPTSSNTLVAILLLSTRCPRTFILSSSPDCPTQLYTCFHIPLLLWGDFPPPTSSPASFSSISHWPYQSSSFVPCWIVKCSCLLDLFVCLDGSFWFCTVAETQCTSRKYMQISKTRAKYLHWFDDICSDIPRNFS